MNERIARIIHEHMDSDLPKVKPRKLNPHLKEQQISDIVGPRRAGKTYLIFSIIKDLPRESTIYINFEDRRLLPLNEGHINDIVEYVHAEQMLKEFNRIYLFLDEVQRIHGWEKYVRSIYDEFKGKIKIFVSGSSANLLSSEYSKLLTGRHLTKVVLPLSFWEFLKFKDLDIEGKIITERNEALIKKYLKEYLRFGGFPEVVLGSQKEIMLSQLFSDIVSRDILSRTEIRNENVMEEFSNYCAANVSNLLSFGKMTRYFKSRGIKISTPTLIQYFKHMKNAYLFFDNVIFSHKIKDQLQYPRKIYCIDSGFANLSGAENMERLCENAVAVEFLRRGIDAYYWKSKSQEEVDFLIKQKRKFSAIQVCYDPESQDTRNREIKFLVRCMEEFKMKESKIITFDYEEEERINGKKIIFIPLWKYLLGIS